MRRALLILVLSLFAAAVPGAQSVPQRQQEFEIEHELEQLPTYGVFDFISFSYERGKGRKVYTEDQLFFGAVRMRSKRTRAAKGPRPKIKLH